MAKPVVQTQAGSPTAETRLSGTDPSKVTTDGTILGTPTYMSPEQTRGLEVDKRTDIWAFGCCLYEALTGRIPFEGRTISDTIAAVLEHEPDWSRLPAELPHEVKTLLRRSLDKDIHGRLSSLRDIAITLEETADGLRKPLATGGRPEYRDSQTSPQADRSIEKIAVLPFDNLMGDPEQEYFVDGMTETLVAQLAKIKGMRVISRTSAMHYKKSDKPIPIIASELGVDALVEGSILRAGNDLRITAQLVHGRTDEHLWADSYDGKLENILSLQSEVALDIAKEIQIAVSPGDARRMLEQRAIDPKAHEAVLRGRFHWNKRTKKGFEEAAKEFQHAIELDPDYAPGHSGLADTYVQQVVYGHVRPLQIMPLAKMEAERAVELDPASAHGFTSLGRTAVTFEWDWDKTEELYLRAIELDPDYPTTHLWYGDFLYTVAGRLDEGLAEASLAYQLDPLAPAISFALGAAHEFRRDFGRAIEQFQHTLDMHPNFTPALMRIGFCYLYTGDYDSARPYLERFRATPGGSVAALMFDARFLAAAGKKEEAKRSAAEALQKLRTTDFFNKALLAVAFWETGEDKRAFALLSEAVNERAPTAPFGLAANPWFDPMRGDPRFQALLDQMNLPPLPPDHPVAILDRQRKAPAGDR